MIPLIILGGSPPWLTRRIALSRSGVLLCYGSSQRVLASWAVLAYWLSTCGVRSGRGTLRALERTDLDMPSAPLLKGSFVSSSASGSEFLERNRKLTVVRSNLWAEPCQFAFGNAQ
jgi:hypothetical protein